MWSGDGLVLLVAVGTAVIEPAATVLFIPEPGAATLGNPTLDTTGDGLA